MMRRLLAWIFYDAGMAYLRLSEWIQGDGDGPWEPMTCFQGNQFCDDVTFLP